MEKLKSRKFWLAIAGALIPIINQEFGLILDTKSVIGILGFLAASIASLAHVDVKKAQNGGIINEHKQPTNTIGDTK